MSRHAYRAAVILFSVVIASTSLAQDLEVFLGSYSNASITIDGDTSDWNLSQFQTPVWGGTNSAEEIFNFNDDEMWMRTTGTGDIAFTGWDDTNENLLYGSRADGRAFPENPDGTIPTGIDSVATGVIDLSATIYARHNATHQYFLAVVEDDEITTVNAQQPDNPAGGPDGPAWRNDSVEFFIDPDGSGGARDVESDVQLVIDAGGQVQVWDSSPAYEAQIEAGVEANVTITDTGYTIEVGIDKSVFNSEPGAVLGPDLAPLGEALDPDGNNFGIDFNIRDQDDPFEENVDGGFVGAYSSVLAWAEPGGSGGGSKEPDTWGQLFAIESDPVGGLLCDFDSDGDCDHTDIDTLYGTDPSGTDIETWLSQASDPENTALDSATDVLVVGDINLSGEVDSSDLGLLLNNFGSDANTWMAGDLNDSGEVDSSDLGLLLNNFGFTSAAAAASAVPEPNAIVLLGTCLLGLLAVRRRT